MSQDKYGRDDGLAGWALAACALWVFVCGFPFALCSGSLDSLLYSPDDQFRSMSQSGEMVESVLFCWVVAAVPAVVISLGVFATMADRLWPEDE